MLFGSRENEAGLDRSFLPEDYVARRAERRTNLLSLTLFIVVTAGVVAAFFVTNRQWNDVKRYQEAINVRYGQAAKDIEQLKVLEDQKTELLRKAELTTALIERVPRSILLAELINRMPPQMTLLELEVESEKIAERRSKRSSKDAKGKGSSKKSRSLASKSAKGGDEDDASEVAVPRFRTKIMLIGVAPLHRDVARYVAALQECELIDGVELKYSEKRRFQDIEMNRYQIEVTVSQSADARRIEPLENPRVSPAAAAGEGPASLADLLQEGSR